MKRLFAVLLLIVIIAATLFGCAKANTSGENGGFSSENSSVDFSGVVSNTRPEKIIRTYALTDEFYMPDFQKLYFKDEASGKEMPYSLYLPENYSPNKKYPLLLGLHGIGARGTDHVSATGYLKDIFMHNADIVKSAILVIPQCADSNGWWSIDDADGTNNGWGAVAMRLVKNIEENYSVDFDRLYIMGVSMGGIGTWTLLQEYGDQFAAGVPICGIGNALKANVLKDIPIWIYHGDADETVNVSFSTTMYNAIKGLGGKKIHFTKLADVGHNSWQYAFADRELLSWLFSQNKSTNHDGSYKMMPYFKVVDSNDNIVISEADAKSVSLESNSNGDQLEFVLTDAGVEKLTNAYLNSGGKEFSVYLGNVRIIDFTATTRPIDKKFVIAEVLDSYNYWEYYERISKSMSE